MPRLVLVSHVVDPRRCMIVPAECLEEAMVRLIITAADSGSLTTHGITATASSRQLLSCASFYELPNVRAVLPKALVTQLIGAQDRLTSVAGGSFDSLFSRIEAADMQPCIIAANALAAAKPAAAKAGNAADTAALAIFALVRVLSWIPAEYFATISELPALLTVLCRLDKVLIAAVLCGAVHLGADTSQTVSVLRQVVTRLIAVSGEAALAWTTETQMQWLARSLDVLVLATLPQQPDGETVALATGALMGQLSNGVSGGASVSMVLAAAASSSSNLRDLAVSCASQDSPAEETAAFLPRTVQLQQHRRAPLPPAQANASHALALSKAALVASALTAVVGARPSGEWRILQQLVADALDALCASTASHSAQTLALCRPLFKALAATLELEAEAGSALELEARVSSERVTGLLHAAAQMLARGLSGGVELLRYLQAAVKVLIQRDALPDSLCHLLLSLYTGVLRSEVLGTVGSAASTCEGASLCSATLAAFSALAATGCQQQQALLVDTLIAAAQDVPAADGIEAPVQWATLFATLQLLAVLVRTIPKQACAANSERVFAAAVQVGSRVGHAVSTPLALLEQVSLSAVSLVDVLLKSRSRFPLRGSSVACALAVPATLFDGSSRLAGLSGVGSHATFVACCSLLVTATRCRPHELHRCMPLLSSSSRVLAGALLRAVQALDNSFGTPVSATLLTCAAELGELYFAVAAEDSVRAVWLTVSASSHAACSQVHGKYCAHMLADYITETAATHLDACSHAVAAPLGDGVHALLGACTSFELQQLHVALGAGLGGVRQTMLAQLTEQRERVKYSGKV